MQLFQRRESGAPFLDSSDLFTKNLSDATIAKRLAVALSKTRGDASSTVQVLLGYYKCLSQMRKNPSDVCRKKGKPVLPDETDYSTIIREELDVATITEFESMVEREYKKALISKFTSFACPRSPLVSDMVITRFYNTLKKECPICHFVFATAASSDHSPVSISENEGELLGKKERQILSLFLGLLRTRSREMLPHYSIVMPLHSTVVQRQH